ncbi:ML1 [Symbiodinium natans]|uniref:ML1 protein n=1 Tax=Symbiodinium natans TaxID=878477 RepID=A0A812GDU7_9DINO|nr:ML1 [Symbiodinium natans]
MALFKSNKIVNVTPAAIQGFEANHEHFSRTRVNFGDPDTRPLFLRKACALMCRRLLRLSSCSVVFGKVQKVQKMPQPHTSAQPSCVLCRRHVGAFEELRVSE